MVEERRETETPPGRAPALDSRFRGNDDGGVRAGRRCWWRRGKVPSLAGRPPSCALRTGFESLRVIGIANRPYNGVLAELGSR